MYILFVLAVIFFCYSLQAAVQLLVIVTRKCIDVSWIFVFFLYCFVNPVKAMQSAHLSCCCSYKFWRMLPFRQVPSVMAELYCRTTDFRSLNRALSAQGRFLHRHLDTRKASKLMVWMSFSFSQDLVFWLLCLCWLSQFNRRPVRARYRSPRICKCKTLRH